MSGSASLALEQAVLGHTLGYAAMPFPGVVYVALCAMAPVPSENTGGAEVSGGGYVRAAATFALADPPANIAANVASVEFPTATAAWGTVGFFELWDAPTGGHRLYWGTLLDPTSGLATTVTINAGDITRFSAGALAVMAATSVGSTITVGGYLPLTGGTLTGALTLAADPAAPLQAATRQYVDGRIGSGLHGAVANVLDHGAYGDGIHDDTVAIQNTLNASSGTAAVFVPNTGHPYMVSGLLLPSNTDLILYGTLKLQPNSVGPVVRMATVVNVAISGIGVIDGNASAQGTPPGSAPMAGIEIDQTANVRVSGITLQNAYFWNLNTTQSNNIVVDGVNMLGGGAANEFAAASSECWLTNCRIDGTNNGDYAFCFYGGVTNSGAIGNVISNAGAGTTAVPPAMGVLSDAAQPLACSNILISDNVFHDSAGPGIQIIAQPPGAFLTGIVISNNRCYNNSKIGTGGSGGADIFVDNSTHVTISSNQLSNNGNNSTTTTQFTGIFLGPNASHISVIGNHIFNTGGPQGTTVSAGLWSFNTNYVYVSGNYFYDTQATPTMQYSVVGNAGTHCAYVGNYYDRPSNLNPQPDTVIANASGAGGAWNFGANNSTVGLTVGFTGAAGTNRLLDFESNGVSRWFVGVNGTSESGAGNGSDFVIVSASDAGALTQTPLSIKRSSGIITMTQAPQFTIVPTNYANDAAAATAGLPIGGMYRNGSSLMVRVT